MHKVALLLSVAAVAVAVSVPSAAARKRAKDEDGGVVDGSLLRAAAADENDVNGARTGAEPQHHNAKLLNRLGMKRVRTSGGGENADGNHHRKRLAGQSRSKYGADGKGSTAAAADSQMFVVKLPPHAHYYGDASAAHQKYRPQQQQQQPYKNFNTVPVGFVSNGKPAKVYHWNLPVIMKHALGGVRYRSGGGNDVHQQHQQHHRVQYGDDIEPVPRRTLYYKPRSAGKPVKKSFVGNGKPDGFYVVGAGKKNAAAVQPQYHKIVKTYYGSGDD